MFLSCLLTVGQDTAPTDRTVKKRRWTGVVCLFVCFLFDYDFLLQPYLNSGVQKEVL